MNINVTSFTADTMFEAGDGETLAEQLQEHMEIMGRSGKWTPTGEVALVSHPEPELAVIGVLQVWIKSADGMWVYIDPDGNAVEAACPID
jgi:hypothetical protein